MQVETSAGSTQRRSKVRFHAVRIAVALLLMAISGIVGAVMTILLTRVQEAVATQPYIAVVVSTKAVDFPIPGEFLRGFQDSYIQGKAYIETRDGRKVDIRTIEDLGSVDEAARIAKQLVDDKNCILVIGNSNSTLTDSTLDIFLRSNDRPAYILPIATANDILTKAHTGGHDAVLRMVPDNAGQAEVIERLIKDKTANRKMARVAIYGDEENPIYSADLSRDIASRVRERGGRVVVEELIGSTNSIYSSLRTWFPPSVPPDIIVFVGVAHHGLLMVDQLADLGISAPIIFTDGSMVGSLLKNIPRIKNQAFVLSPVGSDKLSNQMPTYESVGKDAYRLAVSVITNCQTYTRAGVRNCVAKREATRITAGFAGEYMFDAEGNNKAMSFKVYEITGGQLKLLQGY